jgi:RNA polymerase sigma-70 factor (ECF subfamily)
MVTVNRSDEELLPLMLAGNAEAFATIYERRQGSVYRFALRMTGSVEIAEDITQEVFLSLMRESHNFDATRGTVKGYLYGVARNRVLRHFARKREFVALDHEENEDAPLDEQLIVHDDTLTELARNETVAAVRQAILLLPPHYREVVVLCHLQELNYEDAARIVGCPVGTVRSRLHRARTALTERLAALVTSAEPARQPAQTTLRYAL